MSNKLYETTHRDSFKHSFVCPQKYSTSVSKLTVLASFKWLSRSAHKARAVITNAFPTEPRLYKGMRCRWAVLSLQKV